jgi:hypothetical protein
MINVKIKRPFVYMLAASVLMTAAIGVMRFSGLFNFREVEIDSCYKPKSMKVVEQSLGMNLFSVPVSAIIDSFLSNREVRKVDVDYRLPDRIRIKLNDIRPVALVVGSGTPSIYALDRNRFILPFEETSRHIDVPVISGLDHISPYRQADDVRLSTIIEQLEDLKSECIDFYLAISNIDLSKADCISIYLDGLSFPIITYAGALYRTIKSLKIFLLEFNPDLMGVKKLDLRSDKLIIATVK